MAKILGQEEQQRALKEVRSLVKEMATLNKFLAADNSTCIYQITLTDPSGAHFTTDLYCENRDELNQFVIAHKKRVRDHIHALVKDNRLELDPDDVEILAIEGEDTVSPE